MALNSVEDSFFVKKNKTNKQKKNKDKASFCILSLNMYRSILAQCMHFSPASSVMSLISNGIPDLSCCQTLPNIAYDRRFGWFYISYKHLEECYAWYGITSKIYTIWVVNTEVTLLCQDYLGFAMLPYSMRFKKKNLPGIKKEIFIVGMECKLIFSLCLSSLIFFYYLL